MRAVAPSDSSDSSRERAWILSGWPPSSGASAVSPLRAGQVRGGLIDAPVLEAPVQRVGAVRELPLHPLQVAEAGAVGEFVQHSGGNLSRRPV